MARIRFLSKYCMRIINIWATEEITYRVYSRNHLIVILADVIISGSKFWLIESIFENFSQQSCHPCLCRGDSVLVGIHLLQWKKENNLLFWYLLHRIPFVYIYRYIKCVKYCVEYQFVKILLGVIMICCRTENGILTCTQGNQASFFS